MRIGLLTSILVAAAVLAQGAAPASAAAVDLRVTVWWEGRQGQARTWTLRCGRMSGTHPARVRACQMLARTERPFRPVPKDMLCTQVFGGPDEALIIGKFRGSRIWARFNLRDGCQIARWRRLAPLLPPAGTA
jgi:hypothetical protein